MATKTLNPTEITGEPTTEEKDSNLQDKTLNTEKESPRNPDGTWKKGFSGNSKGAPKKDESIIERFRNNPHAQSLINKLYMVAKLYQV